MSPPPPLTSVATTQHIQTLVALIEFCKKIRRKVNETVCYEECRPPGQQTETYPFSFSLKFIYITMFVDFDV